MANKYINITQEFNIRQSQAELTPSALTSALSLDQTLTVRAIRSLPLTSELALEQGHQPVQSVHVEQSWIINQTLDQTQRHIEQEIAFTDEVETIKTLGLTNELEIESEMTVDAGVQTLSLSNALDLAHYMLNYRDC